MSKKLIAVASAFALSAAALVALPASAAGLDVDYIDYYSDGYETASPNTKSSAYEAEVPESNEIDGGNTAVEFRVTASDDNQKFDFTAAGGVKLVVQKDFDDAEDAGDDYPAISAGRTSYSKTLEETGDEVSVWAFTTSTTPGTLTISSDGNTSVFFVVGMVGSPYNVSATFPKSIPTTGDGAVISAVVTDVFGNEITDDNENGNVYEGSSDYVYNDLEIDLVGAYTNQVDGEDDWNYSSKKKSWQSIHILADNSGPVAIRLDLETTDLTDFGFAAAKDVAFSSVSAQDLEEQVASLTAQVAALTAKVAARVSKKRYNTLARKWNAAFPAQKVALKK